MKKIVMLFSLFIIGFLYTEVSPTTSVSASQNCCTTNTYSYHESLIQATNYKFAINNEILLSSHLDSRGISSFGYLPITTMGYEYTSVHTPKGTAVEVFKWTPDLTQADKNYYNQLYDSLYPNAKRLGTATRNYNCHSYAWYQQSTSNPYWMNDPTSYYTDGSYEESTGNVGDIICYFDSYGFNLHSGVVAKTSGSSNGILGTSNLFTVVSKWG